MRLPKLLCVFAMTASLHAADITVTETPAANDFMLASNATVFIEAGAEPAVRRAAADLAADFARVTGTKPAIENDVAAAQNPGVIIGTLGNSQTIDRLAAEGKLATNGISGGWESYILQVVRNPLPGVERALVIVGSDRRGTIFGIYHLSELIGVSPWYWWADVPVAKKPLLALRGDLFQQGPPAVKYRGIFLNDEDWGLRPWAAKTFEPETGKIGPKTYAKIFELLLRLRANYLWPAMHTGTAAFNSFPTNRELADAYGIVMGSSHCEQMLRDNISEWDEKVFGDYDFVTNPDGVLKYWEQRIRENGRYENLYTVGMRGIHDGGMPGGGTEREKAARLQAIIAAQREMLARLVNTNVAQVPQIFCPYKEVLPLYRLMTNLPEDITLVWPDDNYGYVRQFSDPRERQRRGGAGVYYHASYWGAPRDYLWLCSTPPALIAEEMTKAFDYGADKVWMLNVGDLKPAELDIEFFLRLAWNPPAWNGTNTYDLLAQPLARDFGQASAPELASILAEYYRLNFLRKPEHLAFPTNRLFTAAEVAQRLAAWQKLSLRVDAAETNLPPAARDAFFELMAYPVKAAAAMNEKCLAGSPAAADEIHRLTAIYNNQIAGGKWRNMMSDNPRGQLNVAAGVSPAVEPGVPPGGKPPGSAEAAAQPGGNPGGKMPPSTVGGTPAATLPGADTAVENHRIVMEAEDASAFMPGRDANWRKIIGLGYNGAAVGIFPATAAVHSTPERILAESPCLQFKMQLPQPGDWRVTVRALPTFSVATGQPQRYAIAFDDASPQLIALPLSQDEHNPVWQENVLRNADFTTSRHAVTAAGGHTLKIWMVDPGLVIDAVAVETGAGIQPSYLWPAERRIQP